MFSVFFLYTNFLIAFFKNGSYWLWHTWLWQAYPRSVSVFSYRPEVNEKKEPHSSAFPAKQEKHNVFLLAFA